MDTIIIGQGSFGQRLASTLPGSLKIWRHGDPGFAIENAERIYLAVPAPFLDEVLPKFQVSPHVVVVSCTKGLTRDGLLPSTLIKRRWGSYVILHLGGACIATEELTSPQYGGRELETASVLKNVYAIGFAYTRARQGINVASMALSTYLREMPADEAGHADLLATCLSPTSRNNQVGVALAHGTEPDLGRQVAEGIHTAQMIERFNLYPERPHLRALTRLIVRRVV